MVHGRGFVVHGSRFMVHGLWFVVKGIRRKDEESTFYGYPRS